MGAKNWKTWRRKVKGREHTGSTSTGSMGSEILRNIYQALTELQVPGKAVNNQSRPLPSHRDCRSHVKRTQATGIQKGQVTFLRTRSCVAELQFKARCTWLQSPCSFRLASLLSKRGRHTGAMLRRGLHLEKRLTEACPSPSSP